LIRSVIVEWRVVNSSKAAAYSAKSFALNVNLP
jgi:hypothetical protein